MMIIVTNDPQQTTRLGVILGKAAKAGEVYALNGDLGVGKTVFSKGFAEGLGIKEPVTSPTFTIVSEYNEGRLPLYHFDVYRMEDADELDEIGLTEYFYGEGVCLVEWAEKIAEVLPGDVIVISIEKDVINEPDRRRIVIERKGTADFCDGEISLDRLEKYLMEK